MDSKKQKMDMFPRLCVVLELPFRPISCTRQAYIVLSPMSMLLSATKKRRQHQQQKPARRLVFPNIVLGRSKAALQQGTPYAKDLQHLLTWPMRRVHSSYGMYMIQYIVGQYYY